MSTSRTCPGWSTSRKRNERATNLSVSTQAALLGSYGMKAVLDDNVSRFVTDWKPLDETRYRARFYFDPNTIPMASNNAHYIFYALNRDSVMVARLELRCYRTF